MVLYKDNPNITDLKVVTTFKGEKEYRKNCKYIKLKYYTINHDCFEIEGKWRTIENSQIIYDWEKETYILKSPHRHINYGLIKNKDYKIVNKNREQLLRTNYRITLEDFNRILEAQNGVCAICNRPESLGDSRWNKTRNLAVDHCHDTHQVRGLLCQACNTSIGLIGDSVETLNKAINYLNN